MADEPDDNHSGLSEVAAAAWAAVLLDIYERRKCNEGKEHEGADPCPERLLRQAG